MRVRYSGVDCDGCPVTAEVGGFHAGVVQHENDHLDGILYPMRVTDFRYFGFNAELDRAAEEQRRQQQERQQQEQQQQAGDQ
jgi:peptide deformylase